MKWKLLINLRLQATSANKCSNYNWNYKGFSRFFPFGHSTNRCIRCEWEQKVSDFFGIQWNMKKRIQRNTLFFRVCELCSSGKFFLCFEFETNKQLFCWIYRHFRVRQTEIIFIRKGSSFKLAGIILNEHNYSISSKHNINYLVLHLGFTLCATARVWCDCGDQLYRSYHFVFSLITTI